MPSPSRGMVHAPPAPPAVPAQSDGDRFVSLCVVLDGYLTALYDEVAAIKRTSSAQTFDASALAPRVAELAAATDVGRNAALRAQLDRIASLVPAAEAAGHGSAPTEAAALKARLASLQLAFDDARDYVVARCAALLAARARFQLVCAAGTAALFIGGPRWRPLACAMQDVARFAVRPHATIFVSPCGARSGAAGLPSVRAAELLGFGPDAAAAAAATWPLAVVAEVLPPTRSAAFAGRFVRLEVAFSARYPTEAPTMRVVLPAGAPPLPHPNVAADGRFILPPSRWGVRRGQQGACLFRLLSDVQRCLDDPDLSAPPANPAAAAALAADKPAYVAALAAAAAAGLQPSRELTLSHDALVADLRAFAAAVADQIAALTPRVAAAAAAAAKRDFPQVRAVPHRVLPRLAPSPSSSTLGAAPPLSPSRSRPPVVPSPPAVGKAPAPAPAAAMPPVPGGRLEASKSLMRMAEWRRTRSQAVLAQHAASGSAAPVPAAAMPPRVPTSMAMALSARPAGGAAPAAAVSVGDDDDDPREPSVQVHRTPPKTPAGDARAAYEGLVSQLSRPTIEGKRSLEQRIAAVLAAAPPDGLVPHAARLWACGLPSGEPLLAVLDFLPRANVFALRRVCQAWRAAIDAAADEGRDGRYGSVEAAVVQKVAVRVWQRASLLRRLTALPPLT